MAETTGKAAQWPGKAADPVEVDGLAIDPVATEEFVCTLSREHDRDVFACSLGHEVERHRGRIGHGLVEVPGDVGKDPEVVGQVDMDLMVVRAEGISHLAGLGMLTHRIEADGEGLDRLQPESRTLLLHQGHGDGAVDPAAEECADGDVGDEVVLHRVLEHRADLVDETWFVVDAGRELVAPVALGPELRIGEVDDGEMAGIESVDAAEEGLRQGIELE